MYTPFKCATCEEPFAYGQYYWEFYDNAGEEYKICESCLKEELERNRRQYMPREE